MGKPAARLGDMTAHGGSIVVGLPTVLIGGMPAARVGDMHVCPMLNPGVPPPPHVGGPIMMGSPMVLIGGMPAARMGDMVTCAGPPDTIMLGCMTVLIGEGGSGSAAGGGAGTSAAAAASASAATATWGNLESTTKREHWVEFKFVDKAGLPVSGVSYQFTGPDGKESSGVLTESGAIRRDAIPTGACKVDLVSVTNAKWSKAKAEAGEKIKMSCKVSGIKPQTPATINVYRTDLAGPDELVHTLDTKVDNGQIQGEWCYAIDPSKEEELLCAQEPQMYSAPRYYFEVQVQGCKARSGLLNHIDYIEINLAGYKGKPIADEKYVLILSSGEIRRGCLDSNGHAKEDRVVPGKSHLIFPSLTFSPRRKR